jgi:hypothetical protein
MRRSTLLPALAALAAAACSGDNSGTGPDSPGQDENQASAAGDWALDFLRSAPYDELVVEIDWISGNAPSTAATDALVAALTELCDKPGGVRLVLDDAVPGASAPVWTREAVELIESRWRNHYRNPATGVAVLYVLYLDGSSDLDSGSSRVLGYAYHGSSVAMFQDSIEDAGSGLILQAKVEDTVIVHEAGHLLGLVDNGIAMQTDHRDPAHGAHDSDDQCIMYWTIDTSDVVDILLNVQPDFDDACRADMIAAGGRAPHP